MNLKCYAPLTSLTILPSSSLKGEVSICRTLNELYPNHLTYENYLEKHQSIREELLEFQIAQTDGKFAEACKICALKRDRASENVENNEISQNRLYENMSCLFSDTYEGASVLDIRFGNSCNNDCKICMPHLSNNLSGIQSDVTHEDSFIGEEVISFLEKIGKTITILHCMGGETFLYRDMLIKMCKAMPNLKKIKTFTNGSIYDKDLIEFLKSKGIKLELVFSIDGTSKTQGYMRAYSNYNNVIKNYKLYKNHENVHPSISMVVSILNVFDLEDILEELVDINEISEEIRFCVLSRPRCYNILNMTDDSLKEMALNAITSIMEKYKNIDMVSFVKEKHIKPTEKIKALENIKRHDKKHGYNMKEYLHPLIYNYLTKEE